MPKKYKLLVNLPPAVYMSCDRIESALLKEGYQLMAGDLFEPALSQTIDALVGAGRIVLDQTCRYPLVGVTAPTDPHPDKRAPILAENGCAHARCGKRIDECDRILRTWDRSSPHQVTALPCGVKLPVRCRRDEGPPGGKS